MRGVLSYGRNMFLCARIFCRKWNWRLQRKDSRIAFGEACFGGGLLLQIEGLSGLDANAISLKNRFSDHFYHG